MVVSHLDSVALLPDHAAITSAPVFVTVRRLAALEAKHGC